MWNAFTSEEILSTKRDIPILDVHDLAIGCLESGLLDHVHFEDFIFAQAEQKLEEYVMKYMR